MKTKKELTFDFLSEVISVLNLPTNFKFIKETENTKVVVSKVQQPKLKLLCEKNKSDRDIFNQNNSSASTMNLNWSYSILIRHFNLYL